MVRALASLPNLTDDGETPALNDAADAEDYVTIALTLDPTAVEPRYFRGLTRMDQGILEGAQMDFDTVLGLDQGHLEAQRSLEALPELKESGTHYNLAREDDTVEDYTFPAPDGDIWERECHSYSSDFNHAGNSAPCRFYNHDGCSRGAGCEFSHAPDERSVRDRLSRNVCAYDLLGSCKLGEGCVYSHDTRDCLPQHGWWTDAQRTARKKKDLKLDEQEALEKWMYERTFYLEMHHEPPTTTGQSADGASTGQGTLRNPRRARCECLGHGRIGIYELEEDEEMTSSGFPKGFPESFTMHDGSAYPELMVDPHL